jgi:hypothetical protein
MPLSKPGWPPFFPVSFLASLCVADRGLPTLAVRRPWDSNERGHKPGHFLYDIQYCGSVYLSASDCIIGYVVVVLPFNGVAGLCRDCGVY